MSDPAIPQLRQLKRREAALLTKREKQQLRRARDLLIRVRKRHGEAAGIELDYEDDEFTESAEGAEARIEMLFDADDAERKVLIGEVEKLRMRAWLDAGAPGLEDALGRPGENTDV